MTGPQTARARPAQAGAPGAPSGSDGLSGAPMSPPTRSPAEKAGATGTASHGGARESPEAGHLVIALDGPGGSGKSTIARAVARRLGASYVDTGSTYRALTWLALRENVDLTDTGALATLAATAEITVGTDPAAPTISVGGRRVDAEIRGEDVNAAVSAVSAVPEVRRRLVALQRSLVAAAPTVVVEGRDTGAVVAPDASVKVYLTARADVRAARRAAEQGAGDADAAARAASSLHRRDHLDSSRAADPLAIAPGAVVLDTSERGVADVVEAVLALIPPALIPPATAATARTAPPWSSRQRTAAPQAGHPPYSPALYRALRLPARALARGALRVRVEGLQHVPRAGPVLLVGNHSGLLDGPLVATFAPRPVRILAKSELYHGALGGFLHRIGQIPVDRGRPDRAALRRCVAVLHGGGVLGIFPEGTRGDGEVTRVQDGAAYLLMRAPVPVVPVVCLGTGHALPRGARLPRLRAPVRIVFGAPFTVDVPADTHARSSVAAVAEQVRVRLAGHLREVRAGTA